MSTHVIVSVSLVVLSNAYSFWNGWRFRNYELRRQVVELEMIVESLLDKRASKSIEEIRESVREELRRRL